jgi:hypothetical protein
MAREAYAEGTIVVKTSGRRVADIAEEMLAKCGWTA